MGSEALLPGSIEPGKFYDFIGDKEAFNDLGLKDGEVVVLMKNPKTKKRGRSEKSK